MVFNKTRPKEFTNKILNYLSNCSVNNDLIAHTLIVFHLLLCGIPLLLIFTQPYNNIFILSSFIWINIFILHIYFRGCIFTRIERKLLNDKQWTGPWTFLFNKKLNKNVYIIWGLFLASYIVTRLILKK